MDLPSETLPSLQARRRPRLRATLGTIAIIALALLACWALSGVLLLIFFSILLAASLRGATDWIAGHTRLPHGIALALVLLVVFGLLGAMFHWTGPAVFAQLNDLTRRLVAEGRQLGERFQGNPMLGETPDLQSIAGRVVAPVARILSFSVTTVTELAVALVTAIYFAASPGIYIDGLIKLVPIPDRPRLREVLEAIGHTLRMWVLGQLIDMLAIGVIATIGLWLVGVPVPLALGLISGLFTFVPYIGTLVSGAIAVLIALSAGPAVAVWALGVFVVCHLVEGYILAPMIQRRVLELPAALTVLSMTVLGSLFGLLGIILGTPLAAAALVMVQALYVGDVLGDHSSDPTRKHA